MRTLHIDCVASASSPAHATGTVSVACKARALSLSLFRSHAIHCLVPYSFPIMRRCCLCLLNLPCWWHIKIMFVPKPAVPKRKQLDRMKVNLAPPSLVRVKTKAYSAQISISIVRFRTEFRPGSIETKIEIVPIYFINFRKKSSMYA